MTQSVQSEAPVTTVTIYLSLAARHPDGEDAEYLQWHALDHEPEQHRLQTVWASRRVVSTPECRAVRAAGVGQYDEVDHAMAYFFPPPPDFKAFEDLNNALGVAGRTTHRLPIVERGTWLVAGKVVAPTGIVSPDVLPWRPAQGIYIISGAGVGTAIRSGRDTGGCRRLVGWWGIDEPGVHYGRQHWDAAHFVLCRRPRGRYGGSAEGGATEAMGRIRFDALAGRPLSGRRPPRLGSPPALNPAVPRSELARMARAS